MCPAKGGKSIYAHVLTQWRASAAAQPPCSSSSAADVVAAGGGPTIVIVPSYIVIVSKVPAFAAFQTLAVALAAVVANDVSGPLIRHIVLLVTFTNRSFDAFV